jgi:CBS domain-containing protein
MLIARDLMTPAPRTVPATARLRMAVEILQSLDVRHLPVVDEEGALVGMLSDRDLRALSIPCMIGREYLGNLQTALDTTVATLMNGNVLSVDLEADAAEVVDLMLDHKIGAVPVTDADGALVGIVSYIDVLRSLPIDGD